jgi:membrane protease YdiL (CAAX protease family)
MLNEPSPPPAGLPALWETWSRGRLLALAAILMLGNFTCQLLWYEIQPGLFAPVLVGAVGGVFLPLLILARRWHWQPARDFGRDRPGPVVLVGVVLMALAALAPGSLLAELSLRLHPADPQWLAHYAKNLPTTPGAIAVAVVAVVFAGPLAEELIFRGLVHRVFSRTWGPWPAIIASSLVFGLIHGEPWYLFGLVAVGLMLAFVWEATGSLTACWLAHAVHNGVSLAVMIAQGPAGASPQEIEPADIALSAASLVMLVLVGRWLRRATRR